MRAIVGEGVGPGGLAIPGPGPGGNVAGVAGGGTGLNRSIVAQGHREDVGGSLLGGPGAEPALGLKESVLEKQRISATALIWRRGAKII